MQTFYMLVGIPGSGKSYYASQLKDVIVHSSDAIRKELLGREEDQSDPTLVFQTLHNRVFNDLLLGKNVVYDATNINGYARKSILSRVKSLQITGLKTVCVFMDTPFARCLDNNRNRERVVPEEILSSMQSRIKVPTLDEGWDEIRTVRN